MRRRHPRKALCVPMAVVLAGILVLAGCASGRMATTSSSARESAAGAPAAEAQAPHRAMGEVPKEFVITLSLHPGQSWKSRFVSASEVKRTFTGADGKTSFKTRSVGLELVATQIVSSLSGSVARIEVNESSARILQEGRFMEAPFRQFNPPNPIYFTLDTTSGKVDFSEMEKAYAEWMAGVKEGPAGEILGKTFRLESYVAQLKELYGKPFTRFAGKKLGKESRSIGEKEFVLPFLGPAVALGPVPVETSTWYEGFDAKGGNHYLKAAGKYRGKGGLTAEEIAARLADFGMAAPAMFQSSGEALGEYDSTVDVLTGREVRSKSQLAYTTTSTFDGMTLTEEIAGKSTLDPVE